MARHLPKRSDAVLHCRMMQTGDPPIASLALAVLRWALGSPWAWIRSFLRDCGLTCDAVAP